MIDADQNNELSKQEANDLQKIFTPKQVMTCLHEKSHSCRNNETDKNWRNSGCNYSATQSTGSIYVNGDPGVWKRLPSWPAVCT